MDRPRPTGARMGLHSWRKSGGSRSSKDSERKRELRRFAFILSLQIYARIDAQLCMYEHGGAVTPEYFSSHIDTPSVAMKGKE